MMNHISWNLPVKGVFDCAVFAVLVVGFAFVVVVSMIARPR